MHCIAYKTSRFIMMVLVVTIQGSEFHQPNQCTSCFCKSLKMTYWEVGNNPHETPGASFLSQETCHIAAIEPATEAIYLLMSAPQPVSCGDFYPVARNFRKKYSSSMRFGFMWEFMWDLFFACKLSLACVQIPNEYASCLWFDHEHCHDFVRKLTNQ